MTASLPIRAAGVDLPGLNPQPGHQVGALCWRMHRGKLQVLLISSRDTGRWVIPKGWQDPGLGQTASAAREAWEEAGVRGTIAANPLGCFDYDKVLKTSLRPCNVAVFALQVSSLSRRYPESKQRQRKWFDAAAAADLVIETDLRDLLLLASRNADLLGVTSLASP